MSQACTTCFSKVRISVLGCRPPPVIKELPGAVASNASESTQADQPSEKPTEGDVSREAFSLINPFPQWAVKAACSNVKKPRVLPSSLQGAET